MNTREELRRSAAEYVLGTLDAAERAAMRDWIAADPDVADLVRLWEQRLAPLLELSAPARLPSTLLDDILSKLPLDLPRSSLTPAGATGPEAPKGDAPPPDTPAPPAAAEPAASQPAVSQPAAQDSPPLPDAAAVPVASDAGTAAPEELPASPGHGAEPGEDSVVDVPALEDEAVVASSLAPSLTPPGAETDAEQTAPAPPAPEAVQPASSPSSAAEPEPHTPEAAVAVGVGEDAPAVPDPVMVAVPESRRGAGWRRLSGVLMLVLVLGGVGVAYRELHRPEVPGVAAVPEIPETPVAEISFPEPPPPPPPPEDVSDAFAVLGPQPVPAIGLTLDVDGGTVDVLKLPAPPGEGMRYDLWLVTEENGPRRLASFRETGSVESQAVRELDKGRLGETFLMITREPEAQAGPVPTGAAVYSGMAVAR